MHVTILDGESLLAITTQNIPQLIDAILRIWVPNHGQSRKREQSEILFYMVQMPSLR